MKEPYQMSTPAISSSLSVKATVARVLNIEDNSSWEILKSCDNLHLVHYTPEADLRIYGWLRGVVVDIEAMAVVCQSFGYTPTIQANQLVADTDGFCHLIDTDGNPVSFPLEDAKLKYAFEGTVVRVFKNKGKVYYSTHRCLDISKSRWGTSKYFLQMYHELGGPSPQDLFDENSPYSPYCHTFLLVHPDVLVATKQDVGLGFIVYLGPKMMWPLEYDRCPYKQTDEEGGLLVEPDQFAQDPRPNAGYIDNELKIPETMDYFPDEMDQPFLYSPKILDLNTANEHLLYGFPGVRDYEDEDMRTLPGEAIMVEIYGRLYKIQSLSYTYRVGMRDNDPNLVHRFYLLTNAAHLDPTTDYIPKHPLYVPYELASIEESLRKQGPFLRWPGNKVSESDMQWLSTREGRLYNVFIAYLMAVPLHRQYEVIKLYKQYRADRHALVNWISHPPSDPTILVPIRARKILEVATKGAHKRVEAGETRPLSEIIASNITNLISKEEGFSLYRLVRAMKNSSSSSGGKEENDSGLKPLTLGQFLVTPVA